MEDNYDFNNLKWPDQNKSIFVPDATDDNTHRMLTVDDNMVKMGDIVLKDVLNGKKRSIIPSMERQETYDTLSSDGNSEGSPNGGEGYQLEKKIITTKLFCRRQTLLLVIIFFVLAIFILTVATILVTWHSYSTRQGQSEPQISTAAPTANPVSPAVLVVEILLDDFPEDIGWILKCDGKLLKEVAIGSYTMQRLKLLETFNVNELSSCEVTIFDGYGDGLCCIGEGIFRRPGFFKAIFTEHQKQTILVNEYNFRSGTTIPFIVRGTADTNTSLPTRFQTMSPTATPSIVFIPTTTTPGPTFGPGIHVEICLDDYPNETGWSLVCDDVILANITSGSYTEPRRKIRQNFEIHKETSSCKFTITDPDGICCDYGRGFYRISLGDMPIISAFDFRSTEEITFALSSMLVVEIKLDDYPEEIGWSLECGGITLRSNNAGTYSKVRAGYIIADAFDVKHGVTCQFRIFDSFDDGLCCNSKIPGYYQVSFNNDILFSDTFYDSYEAIDFKIPSPTLTL